jgi:hypothetical protein
MRMMMRSALKAGLRVKVQCVHLISCPVYAFILHLLGSCFGLCKLSWFSSHYYLLLLLHFQNTISTVDITYNNYSPSFHHSESGFGDVDGDGGDGNISDFAASCLDTLAAAFEPLEILQTCMSAAWTLVSEVSGVCVGCGVSGGGVWVGIEHLSSLKCELSWEVLCALCCGIDVCTWYGYGVCVGYDHNTV